MAPRSSIIMILILSTLAIFANAAPIVLLGRQQQTAALVSQAQAQITDLLSMTTSSLVVPTAALVNTVTPDVLVTSSSQTSAVTPSSAPVVNNVAMTSALSQVIASPTPVVEVDAPAPSSPSTPVAAIQPIGLSASSAAPIVTSTASLSGQSAGSASQTWYATGTLPSAPARPTSSSVDAESEGGPKKQHKLTQAETVLLAIGGLFSFLVLSFLLLRLAFPRRKSTTRGSFAEEADFFKV